MTHYPLTLAAVASEERSAWDVAFALADELPRSASGDSVRPGAYDDAAAYLAEHGYERRPSYLDHLNRVGRWADPRSRSHLSRYSIRAAQVAKDAGLTPDEFMARWDEGQPDGKPHTLRSFSASLDRPWSDTTPTAPTAEQVVEAVRENPEIADAVGRDRSARVEVERAASRSAAEDRAVANAGRATRGQEPIEDPADTPLNEPVGGFALVARFAAIEHDLSTLLADIRRGGVPDAAHDTAAMWAERITEAAAALLAYLTTGDDDRLAAAIDNLTTEGTHE